MTTDPGTPILAVRNLTVSYHDTDHGPVRLIEDLSFDIRRAELMGLVGESGAGKTLVALSILRLLDRPVRVESGEVLFEGEDLMRLSERRLNDIRGRRIALIPQDASLALNPVLRVGDQVTEVLGRHLRLTGAPARQRALEVFERVGLAAPERVFRAYPKQLSGGMKQRVGIALALSCDPVLLLADNPTSAVDVTIQAQILSELRALTRQTGVSILFITHDLRVVSSICSRVLVLYAGQANEEGPVDLLLRSPRHPYTGALVGCSPSVERRVNPLPVVPGAPPSEPGLVRGCRFHTRCPQALDACANEYPPFIRETDGRHLACWNPLHV